MTSAKLRSLVKHWRRIMAIDPEWSIDCHVHATPDDVPAEYHDCQAFIAINEPIMNAQLHYNVWRVEDDPSHVVAHEIAHLVMSPISTIASCALGAQYAAVAENVIEQTTERIARSLIRASSSKGARK